MSLQSILNKINPRKLFLVDALGAVLSAFMLGVVLVKLKSTIGMSENILYVLAVIPCFFAIYSFCCFLGYPKNWRVFMKIIALANLSYCCLTFGLIIRLYQELTILGFLYFISEIIVVITLSLIELQTASKMIYTKPEKPTSFPQKKH